MVQVEELASAKCKYHTLVVLLQLVVHFGRDERGELAVRKRLILVESLTVNS